MFIDMRVDWCPNYVLDVQEDSMNYWEGSYVATLSQSASVEVEEAAAIAANSSYFPRRSAASAQPAVHAMYA